jgi:hypothetical protein
MISSRDLLASPGHQRPVCLSRVPADFHGPAKMRGPARPQVRSEDRSGSNSEIGGRNREVRFTPERRLNSDIAACPKGAKIGIGVTVVLRRKGPN